MNPIITFADLCAAYSNTREKHEWLFSSLTQQYTTVPEFVRLRSFVEANRYGYGERAFYPMWDMLVAELPRQFRCLEIGVFRGQTLALLDICARRHSKDALLVGITPLDSRDGHPQSDYRADISRLLWEHAPHANVTLIPLASTEPEAARRSSAHAPYDVVYIDGGHDYETVVHDIKTYREQVAIGGYLVMDDASNFLHLPPRLFPGILSVSQATCDVLESDERFVHLVAVGHNRIWQRIS